jgi:hypothetical protein
MVPAALAVRSTPNEFSKVLADLINMVRDEMMHPKRFLFFAIQWLR